jgi:hypothetical protein
MAPSVAEAMEDKVVALELQGSMVTGRFSAKSVAKETTPRLSADTA